MKISEIIKELSIIQSKEGDIEVTCTASLLHDGFAEKNSPIPDVFESTVETLIVKESPDGAFGSKRVRLYM